MTSLQEVAGSSLTWSILELEAILFGLKSISCSPNLHMRIRMDNTTALAYAKNMGGTCSVQCLTVARDIWTWAQDNKC